MEITNELTNKVKKWLGKDGEEFFEWCLKEHEEIAPVYLEEGLPHPVHFREGMQVRNFMRGTGLCNNWTAIDFDDNWIEVVRRALNIE